MLSETWEPEKGLGKLCQVSHVTIENAKHVFRSYMAINMKGIIEIIIAQKITMFIKND